MTNPESAYKEFRRSQKDFKSSDGVIKYIDSGQGKVVLLLHGVPTSSWLYRHIIPELNSKGYRVIAPDMLGFGSSDNPSELSLYTAQQHAKRLLELMDHLELNTWTQVIHDAGGCWTWEVFKIQPQRISSLILLNTIVYEEGFNPPIRMKEGGFAKLSMWLYRQGMSSRILLKQLFKNGLVNKTLSKSEFEGYRLPLTEGRTHGLYQFYTTVTQDFPNNDSTIEKIKIPVGLIWGKEDGTLQIEPQKERIIQNLGIKKEHIHLLDGDHFILEEFPEQIIKKMILFLNEINNDTPKKQ